MAAMLGLAKFRLKKIWATSNRVGEQVQCYKMKSPDGLSNGGKRGFCLTRERLM
jgi:hypothetical protein